jgi:hypothetical protein
MRSLSLQDAFLAVPIVYEDRIHEAKPPGPKQLLQLRKPDCPAKTALILRSMIHDYEALLLEQ